MRRAAACTLVLLFLSAIAPSARAQESVERERGAPVAIAFDYERGAIVAAPRPPSGATLAGTNGFKVRVGTEIHAPLVRLTPELAYGFQHLVAGDSRPAYSWDNHRLLMGARLGVGEVVVPSIYGHFGYGWRSSDDPTVPLDGGGAFDLGFALDFRFLPHVGFGGHIEYASLDTQYAPRWLAAGLQADVAF